MQAQENFYSLVVFYSQSKQPHHFFDINIISFTVSIINPKLWRNILNKNEPNGIKKATLVTIVSG